MRGSRALQDTLAALAVAIAVAGIFAPARDRVEAQQSQPPSFVDPRRLPPTEAERKAEEERRLAEAEAKRKAEEEEARRRAAAAAAAEAEAKRKAEEEEARRRAAAAAAAEVEAKRKAEEEEVRRRAAAAAAAEAEAKRKAEEEEARRRAAAAAAVEAEAKRKAEEEEARRRAAAAAAAEVEAKRKAEEEEVRRRPQPATAVSPASGVACAPDRVASEPMDGGLLAISVDAPCRAGQALTLRYGAVAFELRLSAAGALATTLDLFQGVGVAASIEMSDGTKHPLALDAVSLAGMAKVALVWKADADLDLHALEYAAVAGGKGHVWHGAPSSSAASRSESREQNRGRGFLSRSDDGRGRGDKVEVYTFWTHPDQPTAVVSMALGHATAQTSAQTSAQSSVQSGGCGPAGSPPITFEAILLMPGGRTQRELGAIARLACGQSTTDGIRLIRDAIPDLTIRP